MTQPLRKGPDRCTTLPEDAAGRKEYPIATGLLDYFPDALAAVAHLSWRGNQQHNPGQPLHWNRAKSSDHADTLARHFLERGTLDTDGIRHSAKVAWRALALLQQEIEAESRTGWVQSRFYCPQCEVTRTVVRDAAVSADDVECVCGSKCEQRGDKGGPIAEPAHDRL
jgi:hypothetical protein